MSSALEPWAFYGAGETIIEEFTANPKNDTLSVYALDILNDAEPTGSEANDVRLRRSSHISSLSQLQAHLAEAVLPETKVQIIGVELLSGDGLKALSSTLDVHYDFWAWVLSDEATDGYWMHDHNGHKVLCFDQATVEEFVGPRHAVLPKGYLQRGRLKQISSIHQYTYQDPETDTLFVTRRCTGYLCRRADVPVFLYIFEDAVNPLKSVGFDVKCPPQGFSGPSVQWLLDHLQQRPDIAKALAEDPFEAIAIISRKQLDNWTMFFTRVARDIEAVDSSLDDLNAPDHKLLATATSLQREISLNLTFFRSIIEAQEGFLSHVVNQKSKGLKWVPQRSEEKLRLVVKKATGQKTRLEMLRNRAQNILNFMFSRITIRQAQLNTEQAQRSVEIAMLTRVDTKATLDQGRSMKRLSLVAGLFLPASTIAAIFGMNVREISGSADEPALWLYFLVAFFGTALCLMVMEPEWLHVRRSWRKRSVDCNGSKDENTVV